MCIRDRLLSTTDYGMVAVLTIFSAMAGIFSESGFILALVNKKEVKHENHLEGTEVTDFFTARDGKVYLLMEQPSETQGKDWLSIPSTYTAVEIQLDWAEQRVLETTLFPLGLLKFQFHYLRPAGEHFLLLGARCAYRENGPDQNAWIVSRDGEMCIRDSPRDMQRTAGRSTSTTETAR